MHGPHTILSVGRDSALLTHRHSLLTRAGYSVTSAAQPVKALHLLDGHAFDLILVGLHARSERVCIEQLQKEKNVRVLFLTCEGDLAFTERFGDYEDCEILRQVADALTRSN